MWCSAYQLFLKLKFSPPQSQQRGVILIPFLHEYAPNAVRADGLSLSSLTLKECRRLNALFLK